MNKLFLYQKLFSIFKEIPPYFYSTYDLWQCSNNPFGIDDFSNEIFLTVISSKNPFTIFQEKVIVLGQLIT